MKRISFVIGAGAGAVLLPLLLSIPRLSPAAATSDVADAVMRGDSIAVQALLDKHADVNVAAARWSDRAPLGRVPVR